MYVLQHRLLYTKTFQKRQPLKSPRYPFYANMNFFQKHKNQIFRPVYIPKLCLELPSVPPLPIYDGQRVTVDFPLKILISVEIKTVQSIKALPFR